MMTKAKLKGVAVLVFAMSLVLTAWDSDVGTHVELEGCLYVAGDSRGTPRAPVRGAVISTSLNSATVVTDEDGRFHLRTDRRISGDEYFTITVLSGERVFRERIMNAPERGSDFVLMTPDRIQFIHPPYNR